MARRWHVLLLLGPLAALDSACSDDDGGPFRLRENATVVAEAQCEQAVVEQDAVRFPRAGNEGLLGLSVGDVLVGRRAHAADNKNPYGFLRRVLSVGVEGETIVVKTARATLDEAFSKLELDGATTETVGPAATALAPQLAPRGVSGSAGDGRFTLRLDEEWRFEGSTKTERGDFRATAKGLATVGVHLKAAVDFNPRYQLSLHGWELNGVLEGTLHGVVTGAIDLSGTVSGTVAYDLPYKLVKPLVFVAFGIPVEATLEVTAGVHCEASAEADASILYGTDVAINNATLGVNCRSGQGCRVIKKHDPPIFTPIGPVVRLDGAAQAKCTLAPRVALYLYDTIGPYAEIGPYAKASFRAPPCEIRASAGLDLTVGLKGRIPFVHQPWFDTSRSFSLVDLPLYEGRIGDCFGSTAGITGGGGEDAPGVVRLSGDGAIQPANIATDDGATYWTDNGSGPPWANGAIVRRANDGTPPVVLAGGRSRPTRLALDADYVYWVETGDIEAPFERGALLRVPKDPAKGTEVVTLARRLSRPTALVVDAGRVYFTEGNASPLGRLSSVAKDGSDLRVLLRGLDQPLSLASAGDDLFLVETGEIGNGALRVVSKGGHLGSLPPGTGRSEILATGLHDPISLLVDGDDLYFVELADESAGALRRYRRSTKELSLVASGLGFPYALGVDAARVFVTTADGIVRVSKAGGPTLPILRGLHSPLALSVEKDASGRASSLLFTSLGDPTTTLPVGGIFRFAYREAP